MVMLNARLSIALGKLSMMISKWPYPEKISNAIPVKVVILSVEKGKEDKGTTR
jgi:hypothetical protein